MKIKIKKYSDLKAGELYDLLQLRSEVFVVEQNCVYQDIDGKDDKAIHVLGYDEHDVLIAYARCFKPGDYFEKASIGRVIVRQGFRKYGYGHKLMEASICEIEKGFKTTTIKLSAQQYLTDFYTQHGFKAIGEGYLEDGIPHIAMVRK
ncbi:GNAT family N-acetyltransferase [soil metagenome]